VSGCNRTFCVRYCGHSCVLLPIRDHNCVPFSPLEADRGRSERERATMTTDAKLLADLQRLWAQPFGETAAGRVPPALRDGTGKTGDNAAGLPGRPDEAKAPLGLSSAPRRSTADALAELRRRTTTRPGSGVTTVAARCPSHIDRRDWLDRPDPNRPGVDSHDLQVLRFVHRVSTSGQVT
jgi:hypothetical protein